METGSTMILALLRKEAKQNMIFFVTSDKKYTKAIQSTLTLNLVEVILQHLKYYSKEDCGSVMALLQYLSRKICDKYMA